MQERNGLNLLEAELEDGRTWRGHQHHLISDAENQCSTQMSTQASAEIPSPRFDEPKGQGIETLTMPVAKDSTNEQDAS